MGSTIERESPLRTFGVGLGVAVTGFAIGIVLLLVLGTVYASSASGGLGPIAELGLGLVALQGLAFPLTAYLYVTQTDRSWSSFIPARIPSKRDLKYIGASYVGLFVIIYLIGILITLLSVETASNSAAETAQQNPEIIPYLAILQLLLVGPGEELLFRGVIQGRFRERFSAPIAIVLATLLFAPMHILSLIGGLQAILITIGVLFVPSLVFGYIYEKTENIVAPALTHGLYNATLFTILYIALRSGMEPQSFIGL